MPVEPGRPPAVVVDGVSKNFRLPREQVHTLKERALHPLRRAGSEQLSALDGVSFAVAPGEFFGIVGRNGSGKSTLLKCLAGIYRTDAGSIYVNGRLSTFIELGVGFNPDLAALDNVLINGVMLGLSPREARARFERVIEFAELEDFVDLKLKNYSSGMQVRLAFSVMIEVDAEILLIDEVLAVGDAAFQQKCFDVFYRMREEGKTILLVTHDMGAVNRFCHRALLLEKGRMVTLDSPQEVAERYLEINFRHAQTEEEELLAGRERAEGAVASIVDAWFEDEHGERADALRQGHPCTFRARVEFAAPVDDPVLGVVFDDADGHPVFGTSTEWAGHETGRLRPGDSAVMSVTFEMGFAPGRVYATPVVAERGSGEKLLDRRGRLASVVVTGTHHSGGLVMLPHDVAFERAPARALDARAAS
jgi:ABC-type polysaccharide/polyol phosphate transport system ATPase subunit